MKKGTGIIIITAVFALLLCAGCAGQEDSAIEVTVTAPSGTAAPEEKVQPETAEEAPEAGESNQSPAQADDVRGVGAKIYGSWHGGRDTPAGILARVRERGDRQAGRNDGCRDAEGKGYRQ